MASVSNQWCAQKLSGFLKSTLNISNEDMPVDTSSLESWLKWPDGKGGKYLEKIANPKLLVKGDIIIRDPAVDYIAIVYEGGSITLKYKIAEGNSPEKKFIKKESTGPVPYILRWKGAFNDSNVSGSSPADGKKVSRRSSFITKTSSLQLDERLINIIERAGMAMPEGYKTELTSGIRVGDPRFHGKAKAIDIQLYKDGRELKNYQNAADFRHYEIFAQYARRIQMSLYPELNNAFRFGGYFSGTRAKYGALDSMHFDIGGAGMGGGSWANGLTQQMRNYWVGVTSIGMGG